jgi:two-component system chemotaxis response regulator CheY
MRTIIGGVLKGLGFEVREAGNGVEGLVKLAQPEKLDLVMVDWNMPEMNGLDFVRAARKRPEFSAVRIVMVTTETEMARMAEALASGADEYVMKPFTRDVLINKLELLGFAAPA